MVQRPQSIAVSPAAARQPIRIAALAPLSRPGFLEAGRHLLAGVALAVDETNDAGGIGGRRIELLLRDTAGAPERAATAVRQLCSADVVAVVGEYHSVVARAAAAAAVEARLPFVCSSAVLDALVDSPTDMVARIAPMQSYCWRIYADYLVSAGHKHIALVVQPDRYWSSGAQLLETSLADHGVTVTRIDTSGLANPAIVDARDATADADAVLLLVAYPQPALSLVKTVRTNPRTARLRIGDPAGRAEFPEWSTLLGQDGASVPFLRYLPSQLRSLGTRVTERLARNLGENPSFVALEGYDSVQVVVEALRISGPDRRDVIQALTHVEVAGTRGTIGFSRDAGAVLQWVMPPVQVAARVGPEHPPDISVLYQAAS